MIVCVHLECEEEKIICVHVYVEGIRNADIEPNTLKRFGFLSDFGRIVLRDILVYTLMNARCPPCQFIEGSYITSSPRAMTSSLLSYMFEPIRVSEYS